MKIKFRDLLCVETPSLKNLFADSEYPWEILPNIKDYIKGLNLLSSMRLCSNVPAQYIVKRALKDTKSINKLLKNNF